MAQRRLFWVITLCVAAVALLALVLDRRAHVLGSLPYLLLLACPLMHLLHGRHGDHTGRPGSEHDRTRN